MVAIRCEERCVLGQGPRQEHKGSQRVFDSVEEVGEPLHVQQTARGAGQVRGSLGRSGRRGLAGRRRASRAVAHEAVKHRKAHVLSREAFAVRQPYRRRVCKGGGGVGGEG